MQQASTKTRAGSNTWLNKLIAVIVCAAMVLSMSSFGKAFAEDGGGGESEKDTSAVTVDLEQGGSGSITITDAIKDTTYIIYKLFDANFANNFSEVAYSGTIPEDTLTIISTGDNGTAVTKTDSLSNYFEYAIENNDRSQVKLKDGVSENSSDLAAALAAWAKNEQEKEEASTEEEPYQSAYKVVSYKSESSGELKFENLKYGYYVVSSDSESAAVEVTTTNPDATVANKYILKPGPVSGAGLKTIEGNKTIYGVGEKITYKIEFYAPNVDQDAPDDEIAQVKSYTIWDSLPDFLENVQITSVIVQQPNKDAIELLKDPESGEIVPAKFNEKGEYVIEWATYDDSIGLWVANYSNNSTVTFLYEATITEDIVYSNVNEAIVIANTVGGGLLDPIGGSVETMTGIYGIHKVNGDKVDENGNFVSLAGATFKIKGLSTDYVYDSDGSVMKGVYRVNVYDPDYSHTSVTGYGGNPVNGTVTEGGESPLECTDDGYLIIIGFGSDANPELIESSAPKGFTKLSNSVTFELLDNAKAVFSVGYRIWSTGEVVDVKPAGGGCTKVFVINNNNLKFLKTKAAVNEVVNYQGSDSLLPTTGGAGVTALYVVGGLLIVGAGTALVVRRRRQS